MSAALPIRAGQASNALPTLGFEGGQQGGQSYGLDELVQRDPPFTVGRVQYPLTSSILALACASEILVLVVAGTNASNGNASSARPPRIIRIDLATPENEQSIDLYNAATSVQQHTSQQQSRGRDAGNRVDNTRIHKLFVDPSGRHIVVSTPTGDNYYFYAGWDVAVAKRARLLTKLKNTAISAIAWNAPLAESSSQVARTTSSTKEILIGDVKGNIHEVVLDGSAGPEEGSTAAAALRTFSRGGLERHCKLVYSLGRAEGAGNESLAITGLRSDIWAATSARSQSANSRRRAVVIATTASRIYQFIGSVPAGASNASTAERDEGGMYDDLFKVYRDLSPKSLDLPGDVNSSELHFWQTTTSDGRLEQPKSVAWMTGPGIYHGLLSFSSQEAGDGVIDSAQLLPYPTRFSDAEPVLGSPDDANQQYGSISDIPVSMAVSQHHFVLLYPDRIKVIRILDDRTVFEERLDVRPDEQIIAMATDVIKKTYWLYSQSSIFELAITDEDQDLWRVHLQRQSYDTALKFSKTSAQRQTVYAAQGDAFVQQNRFIQAATAYAQSSKPFEDVVLHFLAKDERDALRLYLLRCLEKLKKTDVTQRMMIATWLVEIFLSKINQLEDIAAAEAASDDVDNYHAEKLIIEDDLRQFLQQYQTSLDKQTILDLIASHGRSDMLLHFANIVGDHARIVAHWIDEEDWQTALLALSRQNDATIYYRYAGILMRRVPKEAVDAFLRQASLEPHRLLPALLAPGSVQARTAPHACRYLAYAIFTLNVTDSSVHNALLYLYASTSSDERDLLQFLQDAPTDAVTGRPYYDLDYALRVCRTNKRVRACIHIYSKLGLYESSVDLALKDGDLEMAKINADLPQGDDMLRKKLWLRIAKHVVQEQNDLKAAMRFMESTDLLKVEDILPFFPDFTVVDDFKDDVCEALEGYSAEIDRLKQEMESATAASDALRKDIADLQNRFIVLDAAAKCDSCAVQLLTRQFYVFPCQHAFHADCLIKEVTQHLPPHKLRRMLDLQNEMAREAKDNPAKAAAIVGPANAETSSLEALGLVSGRKIAQASVQGLDSLRKLVIPDALVSAIGGGIMGAVGRGGLPAKTTEYVSPETRNKEEKFREELDKLLASSCVYCDMAVNSIDKPFLADGEVEI